ncbi:LCP family protein [Solibacillus sp.]|uniref:LCP family protein n=1 Tax=Solibacillus sp. TaxID=1909654 RepID=UPI003315535F
MEDKRLRETLHHSSTQQLTFTKEDRNEVFEQIRKLEYKYPAQKKSHNAFKKYVPVTVAVLMIGVCLFLFLPPILTGNITEETNHTNALDQPNVPVASDSVLDEDEFKTALITVKSKEMEDRIYLNLLVSYNKNQKKVNLISIPKDAYAPVSENEDGSALYDKLLFAYRFGGAENVKASVSKLINIPIDHYAVIDLETISALIESINGIEYNLQEDMHIRAITQVGFELEKGTHRFNGEEVVALLMSTSELDKLDESNLIKLLDVVLKKAESELSAMQLHQLLAQVEANFPIEELSAQEMNRYTIKNVSVIDGMNYTMVDEHFSIQYEQDFLKGVAEELTTFD